MLKKLQGQRADVGDVEVVYDLFLNSAIRRRKELEIWKQLHVGGLDGVSCHHLQVMTPLQQKLWERQGDRRNTHWHGSENGPAMYIANMDIKTALDVARPKHIVKIMGDQDAHGWIYSGSLLREMEGLEGHAALENFESKFNLTRSIRARAVSKPPNWLNLSKQVVWNVEKENGKGGGGGNPC